MSDDDAGGRQWIVEPPPATGEVSLYFAAGDGVTLTAEQEAALGDLLRTLEHRDAEVTGFSTPECPSYGGSCSDVNMCDGLKCSRVNCSLICFPLNRAGISAASSGGWNLLGSFGSPRG
jgi:hypothetical protein